MYINYWVNYCENFVELVKNKGWQDEKLRNLLKEKRYRDRQITAGDGEKRDFSK